MRVNIADIVINSAQILSIFSLKQILSSIRNSKKASVIKIHPFLTFESNKRVQQSVQNGKKIKLWKTLSVSSWAIRVIWLGLFHSHYMGNAVLASVFYSIV